jgi:hypothetical protein
MMIGSKFLPCYWKDGVRYDLPLDSTATGGVAVGIAVE